jgi:DNA protecting protein DprA
MTTTTQPSHYGGAARPAPQAAPGDQPGCDEQDRVARAALTWLAEPADPQLGELLAECTPQATVAAIQAGVLPPQYEPVSGADRSAMDRALARWRLRLPDLPAGDKITAACRSGGVRLVCPGDPQWPARLDDLGTARPYALWVRGTADLRLCTGQSVTVAGSRAATGYGSHVAGFIAGDLAGDGWTTIASEAYGIDAAAHRGALVSGGRAVAVLAGGLDRPCPAGHASLLDQIAGSGLVVSEWPPGTRPTRLRFCTRGRILAALSDATVIIEAGSRSGALTVARYAAELGRPLLAVPGPVTSAQSEGCHLLIRSRGATLVTSHREIIAAARPGSPS